MTRSWGTAVKSAVLVPLTVLSVGWTATLIAVDNSSPAASADDQGLLPDGTRMPTEAIEAPASVSRGDGVSAGSAAQAIATASTNGIPSVALAAYQRAEAVINTADESCNLPWQLVAAIGRVESDHGRFGGSSLDDEGVATPGIYGVRLDGGGRTSEIRDTDAGELDRDARFDRAIGPMQFIPSTWSVVGVDADSDGTRNPQDIDDAALATAVYLCSGDDDLSQGSGQRSAVYRYNHSAEYVDLVLAIMTAYLAGDYTSVPNGTVAGGLLVPAVPGPGQAPRDPSTPREGGGDPGPTDGGPDGPTPTPGAPTPTPGTPLPAPTPGGPQPSPTPESPRPTPTTPASTPAPSLPVPSVPLPTPTLPLPTPTLLTHAEAIAKCLSLGLIDDLLNDNDAFDQCVYDLTH
ncbi:MAG: lytic murein transglycosylase [Acidimicrobiales bacterium]